MLPVFKSLRPYRSDTAQVRFDTGTAKLVPSKKSYCALLSELASGH